MQQVLQEIGASEIPQILVFNKLDQLSAENTPEQLEDLYDVDGRSLQRLFVSAQKNEGLGQLRSALANWSVLEAGPANQPLEDAGSPGFEEAEMGAKLPYSTP